MFTIALGMLREGISDYKRYSNDKQTNNRKAEIWNGQSKKFETRKWADVLPGQVLLLKDKAFIPADVLLLAASDSHGQAYVQTAQLDGERNLKPKNSLLDIQSLLYSQGTDPHSLDSRILESLKISCEENSKNLYHYAGYAQSASFEKDLPLDQSQLLLRGSALDNTEWVLGLVLFTGPQTKLMLNQGKNRFKQSKMEKKINKIMAFDLVWFISFFLLFGGLSINFIIQNRAAWYLGIDGVPKEKQHGGPIEYIKYDFVSQGIEGVFTWWLLLNQLIPLTLVIILELTKIWYTNVIQNDVTMYDETIMETCKPLDFSIHEELGDVDYIFSDKTGTLTANILSF